MTVRAKFTVTSVEPHWDGTPGPRTVVLEPRYDESIPEDQRFAQATPSGRFEMNVDNPSAIEAMPVGQAFYVDFTPVEAATPAAAAE